MLRHLQLAEDRAPPLRFVAQELGEPRRRAAFQELALVGQALADERVLQRLHGRLVQSLDRRLGLKIQDVTYRGDAAQLNDFLAGNLDLLVVAGSTALPVYRNRQGRLLGWTSAQRLPSTPEVPAFAEFAPGLVAQSWFGLLAPARTPAAAIERLNAAAVQALQDPLIRERLTGEGQFLEGGTPAQFGEFLRAEAERWRPVLSKLEVPQN